MKLLLSPVRSDDAVTYHREGERLIIEVNGQRDTFDFTGASDGVFHDFTSDTLPFVPIESASRDSGSLTVVIISPYGPEPARTAFETDDAFREAFEAWRVQRSTREVEI
ncbi:hypothetical protein [Salinicola rhizosphaerae]|uniref:Uncharacterized protein n=1 Tax=Salinicola rhizosphaerae TaxID=1443141 RepID=A0ABQ3E2U4_9GAMM|nr:hypothetical protein [Salinicola rhizosphaerae]GHB24494.1 hypothetical protein GCM10009038_24470 [Salinicola rhizosphaerae]